MIDKGHGINTHWTTFTPLPPKKAKQIYRIFTIILPNKVVSV